MSTFPVNLNIPRQTLNRDISIGERVSPRSRESLRPLMSWVSMHTSVHAGEEKVKIHQRARTSWYPEASIKRVKSPRDLATQEARASVTRVGTPAALDYSDTLMNRGTISTGVLSRGLNIGPPDVT